jgi:hypothetical protein
MMSIPQVLLVVGACVNISFALTRLMGLRQAMDSSRPLAVSIHAKRSSVAMVALRAVFLHGFFAACTLLFPAEMLRSPLGVLVAAGIAGYLALVAVEEWRLPELRQFGRPVLAPIGAIAYVGALVARTI